MKEIMDPVPAGISEKENFANRKLIRPTLPARVDNHNSHNSAAIAAPERRDRPERHDRGDRMERSDRPDRGDRSMNGAGKKASPPEQTNAENF